MRMNRQETSVSRRGTVTIGLCLTLGVIGLSGGMQEASAEPIVTIKREVLSEAKVKNAFEVLKTGCPRLVEHWADIAEVELKSFKEYATYRREHGWSTTISIRLKTVDEPKGIRYDVFDGAGTLGGWGVQYFLGGGDQPGFFAQGRASQYFCSLKIADDGADVFKAVPELATIASE